MKLKFNINFDRGLLLFAGVGLTLTSGYCSIIGLRDLFGAAGLIIVALAVCLEIGKVAVTGFLFSHWEATKAVQRIYMTVALLILMLISGVGAFGFLTDAFSRGQATFAQADIEAGAGRAKADTVERQLTEEAAAIAGFKATLAGLRKQVDDIPGAMVTPRKNAALRIAPEVDLLNGKITVAEARVETLRAERNTLADAARAASLKLDGELRKAGPFMAIAQKFGIKVDTLATGFISLLVLVFDPLAVSLIGAFAMMTAREKQAEAAYWSDRWARRSRNIAAKKAKAEKQAKRGAQTVTNVIVRTPEPDKTSVTLGEATRRVGRDLASAAQLLLF